jgi:uncharacterized protein
MEESTENPSMDSPFVNFNVPMENLPDIQQIQTYPVEKKFLLKSIVVNFIGFLTILFLVTLVYFIAPESKYAEWLNVWIYLVLAAVFALSVFLKKKMWESMKFGLREKDIYYERGWWTHHQILIPFNRIQHVSIHQSFLDRYWQLAQLSIFTAGGDASDLTIEGLSPQKAEQIRNYILEALNFSHESEQP